MVKHYYLDNPDRTLSMEKYLQEIAQECIRLMDEHQGYKVLFKLKIHLSSVKGDSDGDNDRKEYGLRTSQIVVRPSGENGEVYHNEIIRDLEESFESLKLNESGLVIDFIEHAELTFSKVNNTSVAGHYVPLPKWLQSKKAIINIQNKDEFCFKWAVTRALNMERSNNVRVTPYLRTKAKGLDWSGVEFPVAIGGDDVLTFERNNKVGICIYAHSEEGDGGSVVYRFRSPGRRYGKVINLFMLKLPVGESFQYHFCPKHRLSALLRTFCGQERRVVCCRYCPARFYDKKEFVGPDQKKGWKKVTKATELRDLHEERYHGSDKGDVKNENYRENGFTPQEVMPDTKRNPENGILKFRSWDHLFPNPMFGVADFESALVDHYEVIGGETITDKRHVVVAFSLWFVSDVPDLQFPRID